MKHLTTAALALALAAGVAAARADQPDKNHPSGGQRPSGGQGGQHPSGPAPGGQGQHGGGPGGGQSFSRGGQAFTPQGGAAGGQQGSHGNQYRGNPQGNFGGQAGGAGSQNRSYSHGTGGYGGSGAGQGGSTSHFHGSAAAGGSAFSGGGRGGVPGAGHQLRGRDQGRAAYHAGSVPQQFRAQQRFHVGWNNRPNGWYQRRWGYGDYLPWGWFASSYYLDYDDYDLQEPPIGCEWVREGPDAVLVNVWTGEVLSVDYGVFW